MPMGGKLVRTKFSEAVMLTDNLAGSNPSDISLDNQHDGNTDYVKLTWRSWLVVFITCFAQLAQVFVVAGSGQNVAFMVRDVGGASVAGWVVQGPLLMQAVLTPVVGRLSDISDRKWLVSIPPLVAFAGAVVSATATSMSTLIIGGVLIGVTLSTVSIVQTIPSEILPLKYRAIANGAGFIGSGIGGIVGSLGAGKVTSLSASGWRNIFWMQAALHGATSLMFVLLYHPPKRAESRRLLLEEYFWAIDPIGSGSFMIGTTLTLLALDWVDSHSWSSAYVLAPLCVGVISLLAFTAYEWKGRDDGIVAHAYFRKSPNVALGLFALTVEGWIFYSAVNSVVPQLTLNLGFENNAWSISVRQLSSSVTTLVACIPITWYATHYKDMRSPLVVTFGIFLASTICYAVISPNLDAAQIGYNVLVAIGQAGPLTLLVAVIQLSVPHEHLSTATGLAFSARAIGGSFGSAVLNAIINGKLNSSYTVEVGTAAMQNGLPASSVPALLTALQSGRGLSEVPGITKEAIQQAISKSQWVYAYAYRLAWSSIIPFVVCAIIAVAFLRDVNDLMTEQIEATVERVQRYTGGQIEKTV